MDIYWFGQACFKLKGKYSSVIIDPFDSGVTGLKLPKDLESDVVLSTHEHKDHNNTQAVEGNPMVFVSPGEYEVKGAVITGIPAFHDKSEGAERGKNTIYHIFMDSLNIVHLGDFGQAKLTDIQVNEIGQVDILLIPVGGVYTINGKEAAEITSQLEPKIVIPMHFKIEGLKIDLEGPEQFLKEMGADVVPPQPKLSIAREKLPEESVVVVLKPS